jgi:hypothetical protein
MSIGVKNSLDILNDVSSFVDFAVNEQCVQLGECSTYTSFIALNKPVLQIEYPTPLNAQAVNGVFCKGPGVAGLSTILKDLQLNGPAYYCDGTYVDTPTVGGTSPPRPSRTPKPSNTPRPSSTRSILTSSKLSSTRPTPTPPSSSSTRPILTPPNSSSAPPRPSSCHQSHRPRRGPRQHRVLHPQPSDLAVHQAAAVEVHVDRNTGTSVAETIGTDALFAMYVLFSHLEIIR